MKNNLKRLTLKEAAIMLGINRPEKAKWYSKYWYKNNRSRYFDYLNDMIFAENETRFKNGYKVRLRDNTRIIMVCTDFKHDKNGGKWRLKMYYEM